jgi:hypothetical protein
MAWRKTSTYVEQETVALATYLAVLNDGDISCIKILNEEKVKKRRKTLRHLRKKTQNYTVDTAKERRRSSLWRW